MTGNTVFAAYTTGSGNYVGFFIPMLVDDISKMYSISSITSLYFYCMDGNNYNWETAFDQTYFSIQVSRLGLYVNVKFNSTQATNKPGIVILNATITRS